MAVVVELYDASTAENYDISARTAGISINEKLGAENNTILLNCFQIQENHKFNIVTVTIDSVVRFKGVVINQSDYDNDGVNKFTDFECYDYSYFLNIRIVAEVYQAQTLDAILKDIVSTYIPELTTTNVAATAYTIDDLRFDYLTAQEAIRKLFEHVYDYYWYVDAGKDMHMFYKYKSIGTPITRSIPLPGSLRVAHEGDQSANKIWIIGAKQSASSYIYQYFTGDGVQRYFTLAYEPSYVDVYLDTGGGYVLKKSLMEENNDEAQDFLINKQNKVLFIPDNIAVPHTGDIKIKYKPVIQLIDYYENTSEINAYWLIEKAVRNKDITDKLTARQYGRSEMLRRSVDKRLISFSTRTRYQIGEKCSFTYVTGDWDITGSFRVMQVKTKISPADTIYTVDLEEIL